MTFACAAIFMFLVFLRPQEWLMPWLFGWPILDVVVIVAILLLISETSEGQARVPKSAPQIWLLLGLWISAPMSHLAHTYFYGFRTSIMPVFKICFFTFLLICTLDRPGRLRIAAVLFVLMAIPMALDAMVQVEQGRGFFGTWPIWIPPMHGQEGFYRPTFYGIFSDPNDMAQFFITCMPLCFVLLRGPKFVNFIVGMSLSTVLYKGLMTTHSRGGQVGLIACIGMQILLWMPRKWFKYLFVLGLLSFLAVCPFYGPTMDASARDRVIYWGMANQRFIRQPFFGLGYEMFWMVTRKGEALHNAYVACYTDLGFFGYFFWFGLIQLGFAGAIKGRNTLRGNQSPDARWLFELSRQTIVATFGFCASAYFLSRTFIYPLFFLVAMLAAVPLIAQHYVPPDYSPMWPERKKIVRTVFYGAVISIVYIWMSCRLLNFGNG